MSGLEARHFLATQGIDVHLSDRAAVVLALRPATARGRGALAGSGPVGRSGVHIIFGDVGQSQHSTTWGSARCTEAAGAARSGGHQHALSPGFEAGQEARSAGPLALVAVEMAMALDAFLTETVAEPSRLAPCLVAQRTPAPCCQCAAIRGPDQIAFAGHVAGLHHLLHQRAARFQGVGCSMHGAGCSRPVGQLADRG